MNDTPNEASDPRLEPIRRGRLLEWLVAPDDCALHYKARSALMARSAARDARVFQEGLRWIAAGFQLQILAACQEGGKTPRVKRWHLDTLRTEADLQAALRRFPRSNLSVVTGPGMGPNGEWLVTVEADADKADPWGPSRAEAFAQFADAVRGIGPTPSLESRRGPKLLASIPTEFGEVFASDLSTHVFEPWDRVEIHLGGWLRRGGERVRKAGNYICPPSECGGVERVAIDPTLEVAQLPDRLLAHLADFALAAAAERAAEAVERAELRAAGLLDRDDLDDEEQAAWEAFRVETLLEDFERLGPAIAGAHGHDKTFSAACMIVESGVEDEDAQADLLASYNADYCDPEWTPGELAHKLRSARERVGEDRDREDRYRRMFDARRRRGGFGPSRRMWVPSGR